MDGLMQDYPLTVTAILRRILRYGAERPVAHYASEDAAAHTWTDVGRRAVKLSHALGDLGIRPGDVVGSFAWNTHRHLELYFGVPAAGAVLHTLNVRFHPDQLRHAVAQANDRVVFVDASLTDRLAPVFPEPGERPRIVLIDDGTPVAPAFRECPGYEELIADQPDALDLPEPDERSAAVLCHTSGTIGAPKGVLYSHRSEFLHALGALGADSFAIGGDDSILLLAPMFHANAWGLPYAAALAGASLILTGRRVDPATIVGAIRDEGVTLAAGIPTLWVAVDEYLGSAGGGLGPLRAIILGGAAPSRDLIARYAARGVPILQGWGMTETSPSATRVSSRILALPPDERLRLQAMQGAAVPGVEIRLCGTDGRELPWDGESQGELEVRGAWVAGGYLDAPAHEQERLFHDGWLRTGDIATIDRQGVLRLVDRAKDLVKSGGEWISTLTLEALLMSHPGVREAAVVGVSDPRWGERPVAMVARREGATVSAEDLAAHLQPHVPGWWLPDEIRFGQEIPKTSVGKFDKRAIRRGWLRADGGRDPYE